MDGDKQTKRRTVSSPVQLSSHLTKLNCTITVSMSSYIKHLDVIFDSRLTELLCKVKRQYMLTCKVSRYCLLAMYDCSMRVMCPPDPHDWENRQIPDTITTCSLIRDLKAGQIELLALRLIP